uniref:Uncharacterized protein n=1 Tax=Rhizophora mucronata TaxID=61149 RepID=A0A2P2PY50_RHIMU
MIEMSGKLSILDRFSSCINCPDSLSMSPNPGKREGERLKHTYGSIKQGLS